MKIVINVTKKKIVAKSKEEILKKINPFNVRNISEDFHRNYGKDFYSVLENKNGIVRLYSLQKINPKSKETTRKVTKGINKGEIITERKRIREGHWEAYVLDIPKNFVKNAKQYNRHYEIEFNNSVSF